MATESSNKDDNSKFRFTVDVSRRLAEEIERMAKESGRSKAEVFRLAIGLLSTARAAHNDACYSKPLVQRESHCFLICDGDFFDIVL